VLLSVQDTVDGTGAQPSSAPQADERTARHRRSRGAHLFICTLACFSLAEWRSKIHSQALAPCTMAVAAWTIIVTTMAATSATPRLTTFIIVRLK
jgi:hypothetical protein